MFDIAPPSRNEVELKFHIEPRDHARLRAAAALSGTKPDAQRLLTIYFDSPECELAAREMALRLRRSGERWIQGLKAGRSGTGGLHRRTEWESERPDAGIDLARFADTPLASLDGAATLHDRLGAAFQVEMTRTTWTLSPAPGVRLEVALDDGFVASGARRARISEVEIECVEGDAAAAFDLAEVLLKEVTLRPSAVSKAERGYRLFRGERLAPVKARALALGRTMAPADAARRVLAAGLEQLQANEEGILAAADPEFVHQGRTALRRMRSALRMFRRALGRERAQRLRALLGELSRALGVARDWDVFGAETLPPVLAAYGNRALARSIARRVAERRRREREIARAAIRSCRYARAMLDAARLIGSDARDGARRPLVAFASRVIRKRHKRLLRDARGLAKLSADRRHRVRIDVKRLRYGTDALASLFKPNAVQKYAAALESLQDALGAANDAVAAERLLAELKPPKAFRDYARGWFAARGRGDPELLEPLLDRLGSARRFWRKPVAKSS